MKKELRPSVIIKKLKASWRRGLLRLLPMGGFSFSNHVTFFHDGDEAFAAIFDALNSAKRSIFVETYIFSPDRVGTEVREALIRAAHRGVGVYLLFDHFGSSRLSRSFLKPMIDANINVVAFNPIWPWRKRGPLLFRDHRKIIVVDEANAFCGGINISEDYAGPKLGNDRFRDSLVKISGPAVKDLLAITRESIYESQFLSSDSVVVEDQDSEKIDSKKILRSMFKRYFDDIDWRKIDPDQKSAVQVLRSNTRRNLLHIQKSMEESLDHAVEYCYLTTPYFLPYGGLNRALINAKKRGVDVRILTAGLSDIPLMRYASRHVYKQFLSEKIRIYEMRGKTLHAKLATIDGIYASIGSYNLDHWSARRNLEVNVTIIDPGVADALKTQFYVDLGLANEVDNKEFFSRSIFKRILSFFAYLLFRI